MSYHKTTNRMKEAHYRPRKDLGISTFAGPRGGIQLMWRNHRYVCDSKKKNHRVYTCSKKREGCRARIYVNSLKSSRKYNFCWIKNPIHECEEEEDEEEEGEEEEEITPPPPPIEKPKRSRKKKRKPRTPSPPISNPSIHLEQMMSYRIPTPLELCDEMGSEPVIPRFEPEERQRPKLHHIDQELSHRQLEYNLRVEGVHPPRVVGFGTSLRVFLTFPHELPIPHSDEIQVILSKPPFSISLQNTTTVQGRERILNERRILYVQRSLEGRRIGYVRSNLEIGVSLPFEEVPSGMNDSVTVHVCLMINNRRIRICKPDAFVIDDSQVVDSPTEGDTRLKKRRRTEIFEQDSFVPESTAYPTSNYFENCDSGQTSAFVPQPRFTGRVSADLTVPTHHQRQRQMMIEQQRRVNREIVVVHPAEGSIAGNEYVEIFFNFELGRNSRYIGENIRFYFDGLMAPILNVQNARSYGSNLERADEYKYRHATEDARFVAVVKTPPRDREGFVDIEMRGYTGEVIFRLQNGYQYLDLYGRRREKQHKKSSEKVGTDKEGWSDFFGKSTLLGGPTDDLNWEDEEGNLDLINPQTEYVDDLLDWGNWQSIVAIRLFLCIFSMMKQNYTTNYVDNIKEYVDFKLINSMTDI